MNENNQQQGQNNPPAGGQIQIRASDQDLKGFYSNAMQASHTQEEFVLDFLNITPPVGLLCARVITSPGHVKRIIHALSENMKNYEGRFGSVTPATTEHDKIGFKLQ